MNRAEWQAALAPLDAAAVAAARELQDRLTKPPGSLGVLEDVSVQLAGLSGITPPPVPARPAVAIFVGDHGVHRQGVTAWPQEVTGQMVANFLAGGAVINAIARQVGAELVVVDVGMGEASAAVVEGVPGLRRENVRRGTGDISVEDAMTRSEADAAIAIGAALAAELIEAGHDLLVTGDMGIANTTCSAALIGAFLGHSAVDVTGRGTGIDDQMLTRKQAVVQRAIDRAAAELGGPLTDPGTDPIEVLARVGGLEHAATVGFLLEAARRRVPVLLDGVIGCSAALVAARISPQVCAALIAGHRSVEPAASQALSDLGLRPLHDLAMRLGEGSGGLAAVPTVQIAARILAEVATFDGAGVTDKRVDE